MLWHFSIPDFFSFKRLSYPSIPGKPPKRYVYSHIDTEYRHPLSQKHSFLWNAGQQASLVPSQPDQFPVRIGVLWTYLHSAMEYHVLAVIHSEYYFAEPIDISRCVFARFSSPRIFFNAKDLSPANSGNIWQRASYPLSCTVPGMLSVHSPLPVTNLKNDPFPHNAMGHKNQLIRTTWQIFAWFQA